ncbi:hypothetical protein D3C77_717880 [compost metagenome]
MRADLFVIGPGFCHGVVQATQEGVEVVVAKLELRLRLVLVAKIAHAQAGGVGQVERMVAQALQRVVLAAQEVAG